MVFELWIEGVPLSRAVALRVHLAGPSTGCHNEWEAEAGPVFWDERYKA